MALAVVGLFAATASSQTAIEQFNYPPGLQLVGLDGGSGWADSWQVPDDPNWRAFVTTADGLTFPGFPSAGGAATTQSLDGHLAFRMLPSSLYGGPDSTLYWTTLVRLDGTASAKWSALQLVAGQSWDTFVIYVWDGDDGQRRFAVFSHLTGYQEVLLGPVKTMTYLLTGTLVTSSSGIATCTSFLWDRPDGPSLSLTAEGSGDWSAGVQVVAIAAGGDVALDELYLGSTRNEPASRGRLVFVRGTWPETDIYTAKPDGSDLRRVIELPGYQYSPRWSPDGSLIAFGSNHDGGHGLYVVRPDGTGLRLVTNQGMTFTHGPWGITWSPDGTKLVYGQWITYSYAVLRQVNLDGSGWRTAVDIGGESCWPDISWAHGRLLFSRQIGSWSPSEELYVTSGATIEPPFTSIFPDYGCVREARWSPVGDRIVLIHSPGVWYYENMDVFTINADGSGRLRLTNDDVEDGTPCFSPDGTRIVWTRRKLDGGFGLWIMNSDGTDKRPIAGLEGCSQPDWTGNEASLTVEDAAGTVSEPVTLRARLITTGGVPVDGKTIAFSVDGTEVGTAITGSAGTPGLAEAGWIISPGAALRLITATFGGDDTLGPLAGHGVLSVTHIPTKAYTINREGLGATAVVLRGYLYRASNNAPLADKVLRFSVAGTQVGTAVTGSTGSASLSWVIDMGEATREIRVDFDGDGTFAPSFATATLKVTTYDTVIYAPNRSAEIGERLTLRGYLYRMPGKIPVVGKSVRFMVDGSEMGAATTNANGMASYAFVVSESLVPGVHAYEVSWPGDAGYRPSSVSPQLVIDRGPVYVWVMPRSVQRGTSAYLRVLLRRLPDYLVLPGRSVRFSVDGTEVGTAVTGTDGRASVLYAAPSDMSLGDHQQGVEFDGDFFYLPGGGIATLTVTQ